MIAKGNIDGDYSTNIIWFAGAYYPDYSAFTEPDPTPEQEAAIEALESMEYYNQDDQDLATARACAMREAQEWLKSMGYTIDRVVNAPPIIDITDGKGNRYEIYGFDEE